MTVLLFMVPWNRTMIQRVLLQKQQKLCSINHNPLENIIQQRIFLIVQRGSEIPGSGAMLYLLSLYSLLGA